MKKNFQYGALEFDDQTIEDIQKKYSSETNFMGAGKADTFISQNKSFDMILLFDVIEHLDDSYLEKTFQDIDFTAALYQKKKPI